MSITKRTTNRLARELSDLRDDWMLSAIEYKKKGMCGYVRFAVHRARNVNRSLLRVRKGDVEMIQEMLAEEG